MLHTLRAYQVLSYLDDLLRAPFENDDLHTVVVIKVYMERRMNKVVALMLNIRQLFLQIRLMMIVDTGQNSHFRPIIVFNLFPLLANQSVPYQIPDRLGPVLIAFFFDKLIKFVEQLAVK